MGRKQTTKPEDELTKESAEGAQKENSSTEEQTTEALNTLEELTLQQDQLQTDIAGLETRKAELLAEVAKLEEDKAVIEKSNAEQAQALEDAAREHEQVLRDKTLEAERKLSLAASMSEESLKPKFEAAKKKLRADLEIAIADSREEKRKLLEKELPALRAEHEELSAKLEEVRSTLSTLGLQFAK